MKILPLLLLVFAVTAHGATPLIRTIGTFASQGDLATNVFPSTAIAGALAVVAGTDVYRWDPAGATHPGFRILNANDATGLGAFVRVKDAGEPWTSADFGGDTEAMINFARSINAPFVDQNGDLMAPGSFQSATSALMSAPGITTVQVIDTAFHPLQYNHDSTITFWSNRWWIGWNGSGSVEGATNQKNYVLSTTNFLSWATNDYRQFQSDPTWATNPTFNSPTNKEWSPNFFVISNRLFCLSFHMDFTGTSSWTNPPQTDRWGTFVSVLDDPDGKWTNYRMQFSTVNAVTLTTNVTVHGDSQAQYGTDLGYVFPANQPYIDPDGLHVFGASLRLPGNRNHAVAIWTRDGLNWTISRDYVPNHKPTTIGGRHWEPYVTKDVRGVWHMVIRDLSPEAVGEGYLSSKSVDLHTWTSPVSEFLDSVPQRNQAGLVAPGRYFKIAADRAMTSVPSPVADRKNLSLWSSQDGANWLPGPPLAAVDLLGQYPAWTQVGDTIYAIYTTGHQPQGLAVAEITDWPMDTTLSVFDRDAARYLTIIGPVDAGDYYDYDGGRIEVTDDAIWLGTSYTMAAVYKPALTNAQLVLDGRGVGSLGTLLQQNSDVVFNRMFFPSTNDFSSDTRPTNQFVFSAVTVAVDVTNAIVRQTIQDSVKAWTTRTWYVVALEFIGVPVDGDTVTVNGSTFTFRDSATLTNDISLVALGSNPTSSSADRLSDKVLSNIALQSERISAVSPVLWCVANTNSYPIISFTGTFARNASPSLNVDHQMHVAGNTIFGTTAEPFSGHLYRAGWWSGVFDDDDVKSMFNSVAAIHGYSTNATASIVDWGDALLDYDPTSRSIEWGDLISTPPTAAITGDKLVIGGDGGGSVETPSVAWRASFDWFVTPEPATNKSVRLAAVGDTDNHVEIMLRYDPSASLWFVCIDYTPAFQVRYLSRTNSVTIEYRNGEVFLGSLGAGRRLKPLLYLGRAFYTSPPQKPNLATTTEIEFSKVVVSRTGTSERYFVQPERQLYNEPNVVESSGGDSWLDINVNPARKAGLRWNLPTSPTANGIINSRAPRMEVTLEELDTGDPRWAWTEYNDVGTPFIWMAYDFGKLFRVPVVGSFGGSSLTAAETGTRGALEIVGNDWQTSMLKIGGDAGSTNSLYIWFDRVRGWLGAKQGPPTNVFDSLILASTRVEERIFVGSDRFRSDQPMTNAIVSGYIPALEMRALTDTRAGAFVTGIPPNWTNVTVHLVYSFTGGTGNMRVMSGFQSMTNLALSGTPGVNLTIARSGSAFNLVQVQMSSFPVTPALPYQILTIARFGTSGLDTLTANDMRFHGAWLYRQ